MPPEWPGHGEVAHGGALSVRGEEDGGVRTAQVKRGCAAWLNKYAKALRSLWRGQLRRPVLSGSSVARRSRDAR
jgi:hypothetical protein